MVEHSIITYCNIVLSHNTDNYNVLIKSSCDKKTSARKLCRQHCNNFEIKMKLQCVHFKIPVHWYLWNQHQWKSNCFETVENMLAGNTYVHMYIHTSEIISWNSCIIEFRAFTDGLYICSIFCKIIGHENDIHQW